MTAKRPVLFICATCGEHFTTVAEAERHDPTHRRVETLIQRKPYAAKET